MVMIPRALFVSFVSQAAATRCDSLGTLEKKLQAVSDVCCHQMGETCGELGTPKATLPITCGTDVCADMVREICGSCSALFPELPWLESIQRALQSIKAICDENLTAASLNGNVARTGDQKTASVTDPDPAMDKLQADFGGRSGSATKPVVGVDTEAIAKQAEHASSVDAGRKADPVEIQSDADFQNVLQRDYALIYFVRGAQQY
eukprot:SAG31_NODE_15375_length_758_cov_1.013657_1_plen_204_part_01